MGRKSRWAAMLNIRTVGRASHVFVNVHVDVDVVLAVALRIAVAKLCPVRPREAG